MPRRRAARKIVSPARMSTSRSSMLKVLGLSPAFALIDSPDPYRRPRESGDPSCDTRKPLEYGFPLARERHLSVSQHLHHQLPSGLSSSSGKYLSTLSSGLGAA